jgi:hypothetical protein
MEILETLLRHILKEHFDLRLRIALNLYFVFCLAAAVWTAGPLLWIISRSCLRLKSVGVTLWCRARAWSRPTPEAT